jgi:hypothetical protein
MKSDFAVLPVFIAQAALALGLAFAAKVVASVPADTLYFLLLGAEPGSMIQLENPGVHDILPKITPYASDGAELFAIPAPVVPAGRTIAIPLADLPEGTATVRVDSAGTLIAGRYGGLPATTLAATTLHSPILPDWKGPLTVNFFNPGEEPADLAISMRDEEGVSALWRSIELAPGASVSESLDASNDLRLMTFKSSGSVVMQAVPAPVFSQAPSTWSIPLEGGGTDLALFHLGETEASIRLEITDDDGSVLDLMDMTLAAHRAQRLSFHRLPEGAAFFKLYADHPVIAMLAPLTPVIEEKAAVPQRSAARCKPDMSPLNPVLSSDAEELEVEINFEECDPNQSWIIRTGTGANWYWIIDSRDRKVASLTGRGSTTIRLRIDSATPAKYAGYRTGRFYLNESINGRAGTTLATYSFRQPVPKR